MAQNGGDVTGEVGSDFVVEVEGGIDAGGAKFFGLIVELRGGGHDLLIARLFQRFFGVEFHGALGNGQASGASGGIGRVGISLFFGSRFRIALVEFFSLATALGFFANRGDQVFSDFGLAG